MDRLVDIEINRAVRRVLVRHWIDLGKISIRTTSAVSYLDGALCKLPSITPGLTGETVAEIIGAIRRVPSVRRVQIQLTNWSQREGSWKPVGPESAVPTELTRYPQPSGATDLSELELATQPAPGLAPAT